MSTENASSQKINELEEKKDIEGLKQIKEEAEMVFDGEVVGLAEQAINRLNQKVEVVGKTSESQISQINELGGSNEALEIKTEEVDKKIEAVKKETIKEIGKVQVENNEGNRKIQETKEIVDVKNENQEKQSETTEEKSPEIKTESDVETVKLNSKYSEILDKEKPIIEKISELGKRDNELRAERRTLEGTGNEIRLEEIKAELEKNEKEGKKLKWGEKVYELVQQRNEINNKKSLINKEEYDYWKEQAKYEDKAKRLKDLDEESKKIGEILANISNDENGLDGLNRERGEIIMEFNKKYGYDEDFAKEAKDKIGLLIGEHDASRIVVNNYLGLELPIFSREFKLKDIGKGQVGNKFDFIQDNSSDGQYNKKLLAQKQLALWEKVKEAREVLSKLPKEDLSKLAKENKLIFDSLKSLSGSQNEPHENNIADVFMPMAGVGKAMYLSSEEDKNLFPEKGVKVGDKLLTPYSFETNMYSDSNYMMNALIMHKLANENGLI